MRRRLETAGTASDAIEILAGIEHAHEKLPGRRALLRLQLAHGEIRAERFRVVRKRHLQVGRDRRVRCACATPGREAPAEDGLRERSEIGYVRDRTFLGI